ILQYMIVPSTTSFLFHHPPTTDIYTLSLHDALPIYYEIWAAALEHSKNYQNLEVKNKVALIIGNEGAGISKEMLSLAYKNVKIPIYGQTDSLNAGIASGILMYYLQTSFAR